MAVDPNNRPVRVINDDTTEQEFQDGHIIPGANPPKNEAARGGFGNRDGKEGFGTDSGSGSTAVSVNEDTDRAERPADNMRTADEGADQRPNQDLPADDDLDQRRAPARPVDELDADDQADSRDEMRNPNSRVGMGQMEQPQPDPARVGASTRTNAELTDPNAQDSAIDQ